MLSNSQYCNTILPSDFEDLFSSVVDFISDDENKDDLNLNNDVILNEIDSSYENDPYQVQILPTQALTSNMICRVCGGPANGYNFDQITCESCKAFFRRNALRDMTDLKCRYSGTCVINVKTRRQCTYCRLKKCFDIKMRKEWIRTEEETKIRQLQKLIKEEMKLNKVKYDLQPLANLPLVVRKKKRLMWKQAPLVNPIFHGKYFGFNRNLCAEDHDLLNNITNAYHSGADYADYSHIKTYTRFTPFSQFINDENVVYSSLIYYYKGIPEFKQLDIDDQVLLIKSNIVKLIHLHYILIQNFEDFPCIGEHMSNWINADFHNQMYRTRRYFYRFMKHPLLLKLILIVFMFSVNLSAPCSINQCSGYKNIKKLYECQNYYLMLLWRYLNHLFEEKEVIKAMEIIVTQILRYQVLMLTIEDRVRQTSKYEKIHSLMESIFRVS